MDELNRAVIIANAQALGMEVPAELLGTPVAAIPDSQEEVIEKRAKPHLFGPRKPRPKPQEKTKAEHDTPKPREFSMKVTGGDVDHPIYYDAFESPKEVLDRHPFTDLRWWILNDLFFFCQIIYEDVSLEPHLDMCRFLEDPGPPVLAYDYYANRSSVCVKPRHKLLVGSRKVLKSSIKQVRLAQLGLQNPDLRILDLLASQENAEPDLAMVRQILENPIVYDHFPDVIPSETDRKKKVPWSKQMLCLRREGNYPEPTYTAAGIGKGITGRHYNIICPDDIVTAKLDAYNETEIRPSPQDIIKAIGFHETQITGGLLDEKPMHRGNPDILYPCQVISLNNRWADNDYVDYLERKVPDFDEMVVPIVWPKDHPDASKRGKPSWPTGPYGTKSAILKLQSTMTTYIWNTQYLCNPIDPQEQVFRTEWLHYYSMSALPPKFRHVVGFMDPALSLDRGACWTAVVVVGQDEQGNWYILDATRQHVNSDGRLDLVFAACGAWWDRSQSGMVFGIEDVLFQEEIVNNVRRDPRWQDMLNWGVALVGERPANRERKNVRIEALQPRFRSGTIFLRADQRELINELMRFRRSKQTERDLADALSYVPRLLMDPDASCRVAKIENITEDPAVMFDRIEDEMLGELEGGLFGRFT